MKKEETSEKNGIYSLPVEELAKLLARELNAPPGKYQFGVEFKIAVGTFGAAGGKGADKVLPAAAIGVSAVNIASVPDDFSSGIVITVGEETPVAPKAPKSAARKPIAKRSTKPKTTE